MSQIYVATSNVVESFRQRTELSGSVSTVVVGASIGEPTEPMIRFRREIDLTSSFQREERGLLSSPKRDDEEGGLHFRADALQLALRQQLSGPC